MATEAQREASRRYYEKNRDMVLKRKREQRSKDGRYNDYQREYQRRYYHEKKKYLKHNKKDE